MGYKCIINIMFIYCIYSYTDIFRYFSTECLFSFQVLFSNGEKGVLSRTNFEWNKNDFSQLFRHTKNANEFIAVWRKNTTFNKITQSSEPLSTVAAELEQDESQEESRDELEPIILPSQSSAAKRQVKESTSQRPAKKPCTTSSYPLDESIEAKKVGK